MSFQRNKIKYYVLALVIIVLAGVLVIRTRPLTRVAAVFGYKRNVATNQPAENQGATEFSQPIPAQGLEYGELIRNQLQTIKPKANIFYSQIGITSHHLPTASGFIAEFYQTLKAAGGPRQTFVVVGPDHFAACKALSSVSDQAFRTPFGDLAPDLEIIGKLEKAGVNLDNDCFAGEHSIGVQVMYIRYLYPDAKIVPLILSGGTSNATVNQLVQILSQYQDRITLIASVDFSHYQNMDVAQKLDSESQQMIEALNGSALDLEHLDSPPSIKLAILIAKKFGQGKVKVFGRANSYDFTGQRDNTTGYLDVLFEK